MNAQRFACIALVLVLCGAAALAQTQEKNFTPVEGATLKAKSVTDTIAAAEIELGKQGRLVIRKSGTEPLIRIMAEGHDRAAVERIVDEICAAVAAA